jgi:hypothetical protein
VPAAQPRVNQAQRNRDREPRANVTATLASGEPRVGRRRPRAAATPQQDHENHRRRQHQVDADDGKVEKPQHIVAARPLVAIVAG